MQMNIGAKETDISSFTFCCDWKTVEILTY